VEVIDRLKLFKLEKSVLSAGKLSHILPARQVKKLCLVLDLQPGRNNLYLCPRCL